MDRQDILSVLLYGLVKGIPRVKYLFSMVFPALLLLGQACTSVSELEEGPSEKEAFWEKEDQPRGRPQFILESSVVRIPYTIRWERHPQAQAYEVESAMDPGFTQDRLLWTTQNFNYLLEGLSGDILYLRVRTYYGDEISPWSDILRVEQRGEELFLSYIYPF